MGTISRLAITSIVLACAGYAFANAAVEKHTTPVLFSTLAGAWSCTSHGPNGTRTSTTTWTRLDNGWFQESTKRSATAKTPASTEAGLLGYDSKKQEYVSMGGSSTGDWGLGTAKASPTATTFTFAGGYPPDPTHEKDTYHLSGNSMNWTSVWTEKGKTMTSKGSCTKS